MDELLTPKDVKKILKVSLASVYNMADRGQISCVRIPCPSTNGKRAKALIRFDPVELRAFIDAHKQGVKEM